MKNAFIPAILALALVGCGAGSEEGEATMPEMTKFEGKPDPQFVGTWKNELSKYELKEDGSFRHEGKASFQGNVMENNFDGKWGVSEGIIYFDARGAVSKYKAVVEKDQLKLTGTGSMKMEIILKKS